MIDFEIINQATDLDGSRIKILDDPKGQNTIVRKFIAALDQKIPKKRVRLNMRPSLRESTTIKMSTKVDPYRLILTSTII